MNVSYVAHQHGNHSAVWQGRCCTRRNDEVDAGIQSDILNIISDMPSYGYRRVQVTGHTGAVADG